MPRDGRVLCVGQRNLRETRPTTCLRLIAHGNAGKESFDQHLFELYESGQISYEDALRNADSVNELRLMIKLQGQEAKGRDIMSGIEHLNIV